MTEVPDDYTADSATTGSLAVNGVTLGSHEIEGDQDWIAVNIAAGETVLIEAEYIQNGPVDVIVIRDANGTDKRLLKMILAALTKR